MGICQNHLESEYVADMASFMSSPFYYKQVEYTDKKGKKELNLFKYFDQYCYVKMALIIEGIFISKTVTSLQIKVHEVHVKPLKPREALLTIKESNDDESESDTEKGEQSEDDESKDVIISDIEVDE